MRELEKIKAEKAAAAAKKAEEEEREREKREEEIALGNPLLNGNRDERGAGSSARGRSPSAMSVSTEATGQPSFGVKRRWDDDVIFKNQAAGAKQDKSDFINDMTRSDFHKEFMRVSEKAPTVGPCLGTVTAELYTPPFPEQRYIK